MAATLPVANNTFIPNHEASKSLVIDFSRNPNEFALSKYVQYVNVEKRKGYYLEMTLDQRARVKYDDLEDFLWHEGDDRPSGRGETEYFDWKSFETVRYAKGFEIGDQAADQASWDIMAQHAAITAQRMMTARTQKFLGLVTQTSQWSGIGHTSAVASLPGAQGTWDQSTTARMDIKRSLDYAAEQIILKTNGAVKQSDLILILNPEVARKIAICQELRDHIKQSPVAAQTVKGNLGPLDKNFGLPETLYGYNVVVEDCVRVTHKKGGTSARSFVMPTNRALMVSKKGGLESIDGGPAFSTLTGFFYEELTVEEEDDRRNRRKNGSVVDDYAPVLTAPMAGYLFQTPVA